MRVLACRERERALACGKRERALAYRGMELALGYALPARALRRIPRELRVPAHIH